MYETKDGFQLAQLVKSLVIDTKNEWVSWFDGKNNHHEANTIGLNSIVIIK